MRHDEVVDTVMSVIEQVAQHRPGTTDISTGVWHLCACGW